jgi:poly-gamma-glutamate capsule biosynthesis protein CapA/YwtB (metallophosphatase superfamily)
MVTRASAARLSLISCALFIAASSTRGLAQQGVSATEDASERRSSAALAASDALTPVANDVIGADVRGARSSSERLTSTLDERTDQRSRREATVIFAGDLVPHQDVHRSLAAKGGASLYAPIVATLRAAELALLNFETPAAPSQPIPTLQMQFNVHENFVRALADAGIDAVSVANNHGYDAGVEGVAETLRTLRAAQIAPVGGALASEDPFEPTRLPLLGENLCVLAATRLLNFEMSPPRAGRPRLALARESVASEREGFLQAVRRARASPDCAAVMVSLHAGTEYTDQPESRDRTFFRRCADAGADVVIGHHPHTPHPVERYRVPGTSREVTLFYSLGNFLSNQGAAAEAGLSASDRPSNVNLDVRTRESLLAIVRFARERPGRLTVARAGWVPLWTINAPLRRRSGEAQTIQAALMPWNGGGDPFLASRWTSLVRRVGAETLLSREDVPAYAQAYESSERAVVASRAELRRPSGTDRDPRISRERTLRVASLRASRASHGESGLPAR